MTTAAASRPVRKDVARNRALLLQAADEVFTERGVDATLDDIAQHAGVGVATAYRHFANKQALLEALFEDRINAVARIMEEAEALTDPGEALVTLLYQIGERQAADRGLRAALGGDWGLEKLADVRARLQPIADRVVQRARDAGVLRPEFELTDIPMLMCIMGTISDYAGATAPQLWRRYLDFLLDGLMADGTPRRPISQPALQLDQVDRIIHNWQPGRPRK